jgi:hypothetical protein
MTIIHTLKRPALLIALLGTIPLGAAENPYSYELKLRAGLKTGTIQTDHADNKAMGFAVGTRRPMGAGFLTGEVSFDILPGQARDAMPIGKSVYAPAGTGLGTASPTTSNPYFLRPNESIDLRKESSQGFSVKGGYAAPLTWNEGLTWQAGLSLDAYKTSSEFTGTLRPMVLVGASPTQVLDAQGRKYYEGFATVAQGKVLAPGFYVGLRQQLAEDFALEVNLRNVGMKHFDYRATTYTGQPATTESSTIRGFILDFSLSLKL